MTEDFNFLTATPGKSITLEAMENRPEVSHIFEEDDIHAINAAIATRRPLLLRGEPGIGKSQLARAVAQTTGRAFVSKVVDARTEPHELCYHYDAVRRLGEAQLQGARAKDGKVDESALDESNFVSAGPLWWAFDPKSAEEAKGRHGRRPSRPDEFNEERDGTVVLIDEIDKADASVPNGLLEALGDRQFSVLGRVKPIQQGGPTPLVVITTNEERTLPSAFLRRCWVHHMLVGQDFGAWVRLRGRVHFRDESVLSDTVLDEAVRLLQEDRDALQGKQLSLPGQAELIDLLGALVRYGPQRAKQTGLEASDVTQEALEAAQMGLLETLRRFAFQKHPRTR